MPTDITYEVSQIFELAFGVKSPVFLPGPITIGGQPGINFKEATKPVVKPIGSFSDIVITDDEPAERFSWMGTPIVFPWTLKGGAYKVFNPIGELVDIQMQDFEMPAATLINFEHPKIITRTKVSGNVGTVKEMYGFDDWVIRVRGICLTDKSRLTAKTAVEQKQQLLKWDKICTSINVQGDLFFEKDIHALSMDNIIFTQLEGKPDVLPFEFSCYSDEPLELVL